MKLPKTKRNLEIFERLDVFEIKNRTPYSELNCRLFHNELELAGAGSKLHILSIGEEIECVILFGGVELFELMKETNFEDIDLGNFYCRKLYLSPLGQEGGLFDKSDRTPHFGVGDTSNSSSSYSLRGFY